jgi:hypothetical protein
MGFVAYTLPQVYLELPSEGQMGEDECFLQF